jgi:hypothetical protein
LFKYLCGPSVAASVPEFLRVEFSVQEFKSTRELKIATVQEHKTVP